MKKHVWIVKDKTVLVHLPHKNGKEKERPKQLIFSRNRKRKARVYILQKGTQEEMSRFKLTLGLKRSIHSVQYVLSFSRVPTSAYGD